MLLVYDDIEHIIICIKLPGSGPAGQAEDRTPLPKSTRVTHHLRKDNWVPITLELGNIFSYIIIHRGFALLLKEQKAAAVNCFDTDPASRMEWMESGTLRSRSAIPQALEKMILPSLEIDT
jgi:hypothetical protein